MATERVALLEWQGPLSLGPWVVNGRLGNGKSKNRFLFPETWLTEEIQNKG